MVKMPEATWLSCRLQVLGPKSWDVFTGLKVLLQGLRSAGLSSCLLSLLLPLFLFSSKEGLLRLVLSLFCVSYIPCHEDCVFE